MMLAAYGPRTCAPTTRKTAVSPNDTTAIPARPQRRPIRFEIQSLTMPPPRQHTVMAINGIIETSALAFRFSPRTCAM